MQVRIILECNCLTYESEIYKNGNDSFPYGKLLNCLPDENFKSVGVRLDAPSNSTIHLAVYIQKDFDTVLNFIRQMEEESDEYHCKYYTRRQ